MLRYKWQMGKVYSPIVPRLRDVLVKTGSEKILDLGSGGGGPVLGIYKDLVESGFQVQITLTDKYPNLPAFTYAKECTDGGVDYIHESVDATAVPRHLTGLRTMFAVLHHFPPEIVRRILQDAVEQQCPIAIFDLKARTLPPLPMMVLSNPLVDLVAVPFVRPFRWSRLFWTYVIPVAPIYIAWDALVSGLRLYSLKQLQAIVHGLSSNNYVWEIGSEPFPHSITYLIGYPPSGNSRWFAEV